MIKFFRQIRKSLLEQNKMGKYFKYAIGEILLVVIGILIALQINNWNADNKNAIKEEQFLKSFKLDIEKNIKELNRVVFKTDQITKDSDSLLKLKRGDLKELSLSSFSFCTLSATGFTIYKTHEGTVQDVLSSGQLDIIKNDSIRLAIGSWEASLKDIREWEKLNKTSSNTYFDFLHQNIDVYKQTPESKELPISNTIKDELLQNRLFLNYINGRKRLSRRLNLLYKKEIPKLNQLITLIDEELK